MYLFARRASFIGVKPLIWDNHVAFQFGFTCGNHNYSIINILEFGEHKEFNKDAVTWNSCIWLLWGWAGMSRSFICLFLTSFSVETLCLPMWLHIVAAEVELPSNACIIEFWKVWKSNLPLEILNCFWWVNKYAFKVCWKGSTVKLKLSSGSKLCFVLIAWCKYYEAWMHGLTLVFSMVMSVHLFYLFIYAQCMCILSYIFFYILKKCTPIGTSKIVKLNPKSISL